MLHSVHLGQRSATLTVRDLFRQRFWPVNSNTYVPGESYVRFACDAKRR